MSAVSLQKELKSSNLPSYISREPSRFRMSFHQQDIFEGRWRFFMHPFVSLSNQRFRPLWAILTVIVVLSLTLVTWVGSTTPAAASTKAPSLALKKGHVVHTVNIMEKKGRFFFSPATLTIKVGDIVVWKDVTDAPHTVTSDTGVFNTRGFLTLNQSFQFTFSRTGTFKYHCNIHLYMHASIIVKSARSNNQSNSASPTPTTPPPTPQPGGGGHGGGGYGGGGY